MDIEYKIIFQMTPLPSIILKPDEHYTIVDSSESHLTATFTKRDEIINKGLFQIFPENPDEINAIGALCLQQSFEKVIRTKKTDVMAILKYDIPLPDGGYEVRYWMPTNIPLVSSTQEVIYILNQVEDVTDKVFMQNEIDEKSKLINENENRINVILNALLKYTTLDFSDRLTVSEKGDELDAIICGLNSLIEELEDHMNLLTGVNNELEYANKELDSFSYSVSHDLRAPLRAINGYSQVLLEDYGNQLDDTGKHTIDVIIRNAQKMGALIDDLLTFSRVGKQSLSKVKLNVAKLVGSIVNEFNSLYHANSVEFNINVLENAEGDNSMIKQVFTNLISNAVKYSGKKVAAIIDIGCYKENNAIVYYVRDNGSGFDMKYYSKLFNVFQRLHSSYEFDGTGVGLALVKRIINKHNGQVWGEAELDKGATFYFSLPVPQTSL